MDSKKLYDAIGNSDEAVIDLKRFKKTFEYIDSIGTLLDVGCGPGHWLKFLHERTSLKLTGTEVSPVRLEAAKKNLNGKGIELVLADIGTLPYKSNSFDQVTALEVLEHIPDWKTSLNELLRVSSKKVVVTMPYNETRISINCQNCDSKIYQSGHLHSFLEKDFLEMDYSAEISNINFGFIYTDYVALFNKVKNRIQNANSKKIGDDVSSHTEFTCPSCYSYGTPTRDVYVDKFTRLAKELITFSPHWLIVEIDKK